MEASAADIVLPPGEAVSELFGDLLSKACTVEDLDELLTLSPETAAVIVAYVDPEGAVAGAAIADLPFACRSGSALVMMPVEAAEEAVTTGEIDSDMMDCFKEVASVLSRLLNSADTPHLKQRGLYRSGELLPGEIRTLLTATPSRRDYAVNIEEYGTGRLSLLARTQQAA